MTRHQHHLFLSDAHLGAFDAPANQAIEESIIELISYCESRIIHLHILGDLFDYWMEYPGQYPLYGKRILDRFKSYHQQVGITYYITGNHDNWTNGTFRNAGFQVESEYIEHCFGKYSTVLLHGDGLDNRNMKLKRSYINRLLRNRLFIRIYQSLLSEKTGLTLMKQISSFNRILKKSSDISVLNSWASAHLTDSGTDVIISGHDHSARVETFRFGTYINLGNFYDGKTLAEYNNGVFRLVKWDDRLGQITTVQEPSQ